MKANNSRGYTLIELLVAISLLAIIGVALVSVFRQSGLVRGLAESLLRQNRQVELACHRIEADLRNLVPYRGSSMAGSADSLTFTTSIACSHDGQTIELMPSMCTYRFDNDTENCLYRIITIPGMRGPDSTVLLRQVENLKFRYGLLSDNGEIDWRTDISLTKANDLPLAVRLEAILSDVTSRDKSTSEFDRTIFIPLTRFTDNESDSE